MQLAVTTVSYFLWHALRVYSLVLVARIILTWFNTDQSSGIVRFLQKATDPYLNWWRRRVNLRIGFLDLTPIVAITSLQLLQVFFARIAYHGTVSPLIVLDILLTGAWSIFSFLLWFCIIVLAVRLVGYIAKAGMYGPFWQIVDTISRPILFRVTGTLFRGRRVNFVTGMIISIALFLALWIIGGLLLGLLHGVMFPPSPEYPPDQFLEGMTDTYDSGRIWPDQRYGPPRR